MARKLKKKSVSWFDRHKVYSNIKFYTVGIYNKSSEDHMWIMAAGIAFNFLICIIPFTLILFSILGIYLDSQQRISEVAQYLDRVLTLPEPMKTNIQTTVFRRINEISANSTLTSIIGIVGLLWAASNLFGTLADTLNKIYKIKIEMFYLYAKLKDIMMVVIATVFFILSVASTSLFSILITKLDFANNYINITIFQKILAVPVGLIFSFLMYYIIHRIVPHGQVKSSTALIAAGSSAVMFEILKYLFTFYLVSFSNFNAVYGAYAAVVSIIIWIYYSSFIFVLGAEIGQLYNERKLLAQ
jgi:membrane protein